MATNLDGVAATEFVLLHAGENVTPKGTFVLDEEVAESIVAHYRENAHDLTGHFDDDWLASGERLAASRWVPEIRSTPSGPELWAEDVAWTDEARRSIESGERTFASAIVGVDPKTWRIRFVHSLSLTARE